jgi:alpha-glucosidase (family GH31 glycosyl hydrolase)
MLEFPNEVQSYDMSKYEYLLGSDLLVAPVVEANNSTRKVYLPGENIEWVHFWTGKVYRSGMEVTVDAPLGQIPVFYKSNNAVLKKASLESRRIVKGFLGKSKVAPICLPGYKFKKEDKKEIKCKEIK